MQYVLLVEKYGCPVIVVVLRGAMRAKERLEASEQIIRAQVIVATG